MKYIRFLMALLAVCVLVIPAFSLPDSGNQMSKGQICPQCQKPIMCDNMGANAQHNPASMMGNENKACGCQGSQMAAAGQNGPASMMGNENKACGCQDAKKSDGFKQKVCPQCNKPMMGSGMQDMQICHCQNPNHNPSHGNWNCPQGHDGMGR